MGLECDGSDGNHEDGVKILQDANEKVWANRISNDGLHFEASYTNVNSIVFVALS